MVKVSCALILNHKGKILVAQRSAKMSMPLKWEFPGGKLELNETAEECLLRELMEELNIEVQIIEQLPVNFHAYSKFSIELIPFLCKYVKGAMLLKEHAQIKWLHSTELLALDWADADVPIVKNFLNHPNARS
jgi:8-oxo-dGTP diphosphatase